MRRSPHTLSLLHTFLQHVRERRKTAEGGGVQLDPQLHACMRLFPLCPIDNSAWAVCKISGVQQRTPEVSLKQPDKLSVRYVPAQAGNHSGGVGTSPGHPELYKVRFFFCFLTIFPSFWGKLPDTLGCFLHFHNTFMCFNRVSFCFVGNLNAPLSYTLKLSSVHLWCWRSLTLFKASNIYLWPFYVLC